VQPDYDSLEALQSHRTLLMKRAERVDVLITTVDKTINQLKGGNTMQIKEYYEGFSDEQMERYRNEVKKRWGKKTLTESEARVTGMGKEKFTALQVEGDIIFKALGDNMPKGAHSQEVQALIARWRLWLEYFYHYSDEAVLGLGQAYSQHPEFAAFFKKYHEELPQFLTRAIEYYCAQQARE
jgi:hypothetical protein